MPFRNRKEVRPRGNLGFRLASDANPQTERLSDKKKLRVKENDDVKVAFVFFFTFPETNAMVQ